MESEDELSQLPATESPTEIINGYLTALEAAQYLRVSRNTVYKKIKDGVIPVVRVGRSIRINRTDMDNALRKHRL
ncbi:helix-turn-helix domain-containing protein [uncultured Olsenella sp.]|uniref:helix-turn-helix domain-containing protein n=1 Tax=uncultured Olsenella sp. TaxID=190764 RepID=UPI0026DDA916|nr:helix-turn-helix domain-containing protein [uncultured Olsenella sp.]